MTKIREQRAKEQAAQRYSTRYHFVTPVIDAARSSSRQSEIEKMEAEIRKLARRGEDSDDEHIQKKAKKSVLEEEMARYTKGRGMLAKAKKGKRKDEGDVLAVLSSFRSKLNRTVMDEDVDMEAGQEDAGGGTALGADDPGVEVDDDTGFLAHRLQFPKGNEVEVAKAEREYEVIDPRARGARAKEEERLRKQAIRPRDGGRGSRR